MNEDTHLIELPKLRDIKELLASAKHDIDEEIKEAPELAAHSKLVLKVIKIVEERLAKTADLDRLDLTEKINIAALLNFLQSLLEDFFFAGDFEEGDSEDDFEIDSFEEDVEEEK